MQRDLKTVFAGIAAARDEKRLPLPDKALTVHEDHGLHARHQARQCVHGGGALQSQQRLFWQRCDLAARGELALDVGQIGCLAGAVDHHQQVVAPVAKHQVVFNATLGIEQHAVALAAHGQADGVHRHQGFKGGGGIRAAEADLPHVRDVKQAGLGAGVQVFGHQAAGVLHRHVVSSKGHHAGTKFEVQGVQGRAGERGGWVGQGRAPCRSTPRRWHREPCCPLYLRDSTLCRCRRIAPSVDAHRGGRLSPTE